MHAQFRSELVGDGQLHLFLVVAASVFLASMELALP